MIEAAERGRAGRQRAHEQLIGQMEAGTARGAQFQQQGVQAAVRGEEAAQQEAQFQQRMDLEAASRGLVDTRKQKLEQDMQRGAAQTKPEVGPPSPEQQRLMEQGGKPVEYQGGRYVPTEESKRQAQATRDVAYARAETERMREVTRQMELTERFQKAQLAGDKQAMGELSKDLMAPLETQAGLLEKAIKASMTGESADPSLIPNLTKAAEKAGNPEVLKELSDNTIGQATINFIKQGVAAKAMDYIINTKGSMPSGDLISGDAPAMQEFSQYQAEVAGFLGQANVGASITELSARNRLVNKMAAEIVRYKSSIRGQQSRNPTPATMGVPDGRPSEPELDTSKYPAARRPPGWAGRGGPAPDEFDTSKQPAVRRPPGWAGRSVAGG